MSRMHARARRRAALAMVLLHVASVAAPLCRAQSTGYPSGGDRDEYLSDVLSRASLRRQIEDGWEAARQERRRLEASIDELRSQRVPAGTDPADFYRRRSQRIRELDRSLQSNQERQQRYEQRLGSLYEKLERDRRYIVQSEDDGLKQSLGSFVGIAGAAAIPVMARPMLGGGSAANGAVSVVSRGTVRGGGLPNPRPSTTAPAPRPSSTPASGSGAAATGSSAAAGARAPVPGASTHAGHVAEVASARPNMWNTEIGKNGNVVLRRGDRVVDTGQKSTITEGSGKKASVMRNDAAFQRADALRQMYGTRDHLSSSITDLKGQLKGAKGEARTQIKSRIAELETQQKALGKDIKTAEKPVSNQPSAVRQVVGAAAKWALFSTALTVGTRAFDQLRENDWDVSKIDWKDAVAPLKTPEFWGGTAGSFGLSMLASAVIPGGAWIKTAAAIGGAAVGWQIGSGNLRHTDWAELGFSSAGSTIGVILGTAIGGPIGAFLGGLAGHWLGTYVLGKIRGWLDSGSTSYSSDDRQIIDIDGDTTPYAGGTPRPPTPPGGGGGRDAAEIRARMNQIYSQIEGIMEDPSSAPDARATIRSLHAEYDALHKELEAQRASARGG